MDLDILNSKNKKLIDYIWLKSLFQYVKNNPDDQEISVESIAEYVFVNVFKRLRSNQQVHEFNDYIFNQVSKLLEIAQLRIIVDIDKLLIKDLLAKILKLPEYDKTLQNVEIFLNKNVVFKNTIINSEIIYLYDVHNTMIFDVKEMSETEMNLQLKNLKNKIDSFFEEKSKSNHQSPEIDKKTYVYKSKENYIENKGSKVLENEKNEVYLNKSKKTYLENQKAKLIQEPSITTKKDNSSQNQKMDSPEATIKNVPSVEEIPKFYQMTVHKYIDSKIIFDAYSDFLKQESDSPNNNDFSFYDYLVKKLGRQSYNRRKIYEFIRKYYYKYIAQKTENNNNDAYFFKLDDENEKLGFNLLENIIGKDIDYLVFALGGNSDHSIDLKSIELTIKSFKGIPYDINRSFRHKLFKINNKILSDFDKYAETYKQKLTLVYEDYTIDNVLNFIRLNEPTLYDRFLNQSNFSIDNFYDQYPFLLEYFMEALDLFAMNIKDRFKALITKNNTERELKVLSERLNGKTLEEIGHLIGVTRERIRQIEAKGKRKIHRLAKRITDKELNLFLSIFNNVNLITYDEFETIYEEHSNHFIELLNALENKKISNFDNLEIITIDKYYIYKNILFFNNLDKVIDYHETLEHWKDMTGEEETHEFEYFFHRYYFESGNFSLRKEVFNNKSEKVKFILKQFFNDGIKVYNDDEISLFKEYYFSVFGDSELMMQSTRTVGSYITRYTKIIDKGTYKIVEDSFVFSQIELDIIFQLLNKQPLIYIEDLLELYNSNPLTRDIESAELLSRLLKPHLKYFYSNRFYIAKEEDLLDYSNYILSFIEQSGGVVSAIDISRKFPGIHSKTILNLVNQSDEILINRNQNYIHVKNVGLSIEELDILKNKLYKQLESSEIIHTTDLYRLIRYDKNITMNEMVLEDSLGIFNVIKFYFSSEFNVYRPLMSRKDTFVGPYNEMMNHYIFNKDIVKTSEIAEFNKKIQKMNQIRIFIERKSPEYYLVDSKTFMKKSLIGIDDLIAKKMKQILKVFFDSNPYHDLDSFNSWNLFPKLSVPWTNQLVYSIIIDYFKNTKIIFKNKSYAYLSFRVEWGEEDE